MGKKVLVVSQDAALGRDLAALLRARDLEMIPVSSAREAGIQLSTGDWGGVVLDMSKLTPDERQSLLAIHKQRANFPLIQLETLSTLSPNESGGLRHVSLPLPGGFADQVRSCGKPIVFLVDKGVFASRAMHVALAEAGVQAMTVDNVIGLTELLLRQAEFEARRRETPRLPKPTSFWSKLGGARQEEEEVETTPRFNVVVAQFTGKPAEAEAFEGRLRQSVTNAVVYIVSGIDPVGAAVESVRANFPAAIMRDQAGRIPSILSDAAQVVVARVEKPKIMLVDNNKTAIEQYTQALVASGFDVSPVESGEEALRRAAPGLFHLVVSGLQLANVPVTALDLAKKLRERDENLAIILTIEPLPLPTALQAVSQAASLGLDDAMIKPVQPGQLLYSVKKALELRFLIAENARLVKDLSESNRQLEQINGFQKKFFAMVAHDVKNPLTAILGYSEVLGMKLKGMAAELKCAEHIHSAARTLNVLISDLVDLAAIESGKLRVNIGALDLIQVVGEVKSRIDVVAQQRKIAFSIELPPAVPALAGDPARVGQVIQNLCTNAIQYTNEGGSVRVRVDATPEWVTVSVIDTGIGIKKEDLPRVWERFFQTQEAQAMRKAGFGLGLKISREIVQMHGGDIGIESEYGKGSRFYFTIPVQKSAPAPAAPAAAAPATPAAPAAPK